MQKHGYFRVSSPPHAQPPSKRKSRKLKELSPIQENGAKLLRYILSQTEIRNLTNVSKSFRLLFH